MNNLKQIIKSLLPIIIAYASIYLAIVILSLIYQLFGQTNLTYFINHIVPYILIIPYLLIISRIRKKYPTKETKLKLKNTFPYLYLGISLSATLNMLIFLLKPPITVPTIPLVTSIISSAIIGPILEEYLFRYYLLNQLKKFLPTTKAIVASTLIFAILHIELLTVIYTIILGLILNIIYHHHQTIKAPILIHIGANLISIFLTSFNFSILIVSSINLIIATLLFISPTKISQTFSINFTKYKKA